jgi:hypothetical protein
MQDKKAMSLYNVKINGKKFEGVGLPEIILTEVDELYNKLKSEWLNKELTKDIPYRLHDTESYGIYNGISSYELPLIIGDIVKGLGFKGFITSDEIVRKLNEDKEIEEVALLTYIPYPEHKDWTDEYKKAYRKLVAENKAAGQGMIPNALIRDKIANIVLDKMDIQNKEEMKKQAIFNKAKETGEKQLLSKSFTECSDRNEECNMDVVYEYAMPNGTVKTERVHTY